MSPPWQALHKFKEFIIAQGGKAEMIENPAGLPRARYQIKVRSGVSGYIKGINAEMVGIAAMLLGAGRKKKEDNIDHAAGITLTRKVGERVEKDDILCVLHSSREVNEEAEDIIRLSYSLKEEPPEKKELIYGVIA